MRLALRAAASAVAIACACVQPVQAQTIWIGGSQVNVKTLTSDHAASLYVQVSAAKRLRETVSAQDVQDAHNWAQRKDEIAGVWKQGVQDQASIASEMRSNSRMATACAAGTMVKGAGDMASAAAKSSKNPYLLAGSAAWDGATLAGDAIGNALVIGPRIADQGGLTATDIGEITMQVAQIWAAEAQKLPGPEGQQLMAWAREIRQVRTQEGLEAFIKNRINTVQTVQSAYKAGADGSWIAANQALAGGAQGIGAILQMDPSRATRVAGSQLNRAGQAYGGATTAVDGAAKLKESLDTRRDLENMISGQQAQMTARAGAAAADAAKILEAIQIWQSGASADASLAQLRQAVPNVEASAPASSAIQLAAVHAETIRAAAASSRASAKARADQAAQAARQRATALGAPSCGDPLPEPASGGSVIKSMVQQTGQSLSATDAKVQQSQRDAAELMYQAQQRATQTGQQGSSSTGWGGCTDANGNPIYTGNRAC